MRESTTAGGIVRLLRVDSKPGAGGRERPLLSRPLRAGLWVILILVSLQGVFDHSLWGFNEAYEGGMIRDMVRGATMVVPTLNGTPFLEKPPLLHWTGVLVCRLAGRVSAGLVRLPAALFGFGTLILLYRLVRGKWDRDDEASGDAAHELAAWAAVFLCATAVEFHEYSRLVHTDTALTFVVTASLVAFWRAWLAPRPWRWGVFLVVTAAGFYAKGLVGPTMVWVAVAIFLVWRGRFGLGVALGAAFLPVLAASVAPWVLAVHRFGGGQMLRFIFWDNQVGRFFVFANANLPHDPYFVHKEPWHYYLRSLPFYLMPWTPMVVAAAVAWWRRPQHPLPDLRRLVLSSVAGILLLLHLSAAKVAVYALPAYPWLFALVGVWMLDLAPTAGAARWERLVASGTAVFVVAFLAAAPVAVAVGVFTHPELVRLDTLRATVAEVVAAVALLLGTAVVVAGWRRLLGSGVRHAAVMLGPTLVAALLACVAMLVTPIFERLRSYVPAARLAAELSSGGDLGLAVTQGEDIGGFTFYLDRPVPLLQPDQVRSFFASPIKRTVIVAPQTLTAVEEALAGIAVTRSRAGPPNSVSASFVVMCNRAIVGVNDFPPGAGRQTK